MSSLADSLKAFQSDRAEAVSRNLAHARPATTSNTPARTATPQPPSNKRPHDATPTTAASAVPPPPTITSSSEIMKIVLNTVDRLKETRGRPLSFTRIIEWLSLPADMRTPKAENNIRLALRQHHRLTYIPASASVDGKEAFKYRPLHPVTNPEELRAYLSTFETAAGIPVKELKDGWPDCAPALDLLERQGHILIQRNKKDNTARTVYADNPSWHIPALPATTPPTVRQADEDLKAFYAKIKLPANENDIRVELEKAGLTPTSAVKEVKKVEVRKKERKRAERRNAKKTNTHMAGILKDYSKMKGGK